MIDHLRLPAVRSRAAAFAPPLALAMLVSLVACEDSQSAAQRQLAEKVEQTIAASEKALPGGRIPDTTEAALAAAGQLRSLAQSLASTQGGTPAQRSAAMQLAAGLARKAAEIDLTIAVDLEAQHRLERLAVSRAAAAAAGLEALAGPLDRIDFASSRTQLKSQKEMAEGQLRQLQTQVRTLESAVAQVDRQLSETEAEAARIDLEAEQLRAQALSLRPRQALPFVEQAAELRIRNADLRGQLGRMQSERSALAPQLAGAKALGEGGAAMIEVTDGALEDLQGLSEKAREAAARARRGAGDIRGGAKERLNAVLTEMSGDLQARYDAAISGLERSTQLAQQAGTGGDALSTDSAAIARASSQLDLAQAMALRAMARADHAALLTQINALGGWGEQAQLEPAATQAANEATEAIGKAKEQYAAVVESLQNLRTPALQNSANVKALQARAQAALAELEAPGSSGAGSALADGPTGSTGSSGAPATPEDLIARLNAAESDPNSMDSAMSLFRAERSAKFLAAMKSFAEAMKPVLTASQKKFGAPLVMAAAGGMSAPTVRQGRVVSTDGDTATIEFQAPTGAVQAKAVRIDGAWYIDFDSILDAAAPGASAQANQMAPMFEAMAMTMSSAANAFAARIEAGEFSSVEEASAAFAQEMAKMMGPMMKPGAGGGAP